RLSSEVAAVANQKGRWKNRMQRAAHNSCCRWAAQIRAVISFMVVANNKKPSTTTINYRDATGVVMGGCIQSRYVLGKKHRIVNYYAFEIIIILQMEVKKRLSSEVAAVANQKGRWKNRMQRAAHNSCCRQLWLPRRPWKDTAYMMEGFASDLLLSTH
nr:hypothetical protein [Tanacetum cinerariifolium]